MLDLPASWFINVSITQSAVRNQGEGIARGARAALGKHFKLKQFFSHLTDSSPNKYPKYLNWITEKIQGAPGLNTDDQPIAGVTLKWGAARKCINLLARSVVI